MKKFILFLCVILIFGASTVWADCTVTKDAYQNTVRNTSMRTITLSCTGDCEQNLDDITGIISPLAGWYLYRVILNSLTGVNVTADADVYIWDEAGDTGAADYMGGQGEDALDVDSYTKLNMSIVEGFYDSPILDVDNSGSGVYEIKLIMTAN
jgi:hypothetical protein